MTIKTGTFHGKASTCKRIRTRTCARAATKYSFEYDSANRLAKVTLSQSAEAAKITYLHNSLGQRVFKS